jgi:hypothetical protein
VRSDQLKMGYYEVRSATRPHQDNKLLIIHPSPQVPCQLCDVPFKIGRLRTQFEPRAAAWAADGIYAAIEDNDSCTEDGCKLAFRHHNPEDHTDKELSKDGRLDQLIDPLPSGVDREGNEVSFEAWAALHYEDSDHEEYQAWFDEKTRDGKRNVHSRSRSFRLSEEESADMIEHIAGVDCIHDHGFNGNVISAEEMRLASTAQYIVEKDSDYHHLPDWTPEPDDEDFERESKYFLSGLADRPDGLLGDCTTFPERHGLYGNDMSPTAYDGFVNGDLIFHPHCLEIYKRVSALRLDSAESTHVPGFADWWTSDGTVNGRPVHKSVGGGQWYEHHSGSEFVVANPLQIPALTAIFEAARRPEDFDAKDLSPFGEQETTGTNSTSDIFGKLPNELRDEVLTSLDSKDIANLRLSSRTFRHLPVTLWRDLIQKELPWIWEAWSDRPYPFMSCTTGPELEAHDQALKDQTQAMQRLGDEEKTKQRELIARDDATFREPRAVQQLSRSGTDWHYLYCRLAREWKNIKGLQNRERIWKTSEYIVRRVADPDEDHKSARKAHNKAFPFRCS